MCSAMHKITGPCRVLLLPCLPFLVSPAPSPWPLLPQAALSRTVPPALTGGPEQQAVATERAVEGPAIPVEGRKGVDSEAFVVFIMELFSCCNSS